MIAFDADVFTDILAGNVHLTQRAVQIPVHDQSVPVIVIEEIVRGRLNAIRRAEAAKSKVSIDRAYGLFLETLECFRKLTILPYTADADSLYQQWRSQNVRIGTHDLRIGAICVVHRATLVTRNRRDFEQIPGLALEIWP
jgi:tRNA(fMet)-specific endonuclease VapC